jgi:hypothetical protein
MFGSRVGRAPPVTGMPAGCTTVYLRTFVSTKARVANQILGAGDLSLRESWKFF